MENASKALLMVASMLIGLLIISLAIYLFATFGAESAQVHKQIEEQQLRQFNEQFTTYTGKENVTIYDIVTAANIASDNNIYYELPRHSPESTTGKDYYITVKLETVPIENGYGDVSKKDTDYYSELIKENMTKNFKCQVKLSNFTGRIYEVSFSEKK